MARLNPTDIIGWTILDTTRKYYLDRDEKTWKPFQGYATAYVHEITMGAIKEIAKKAIKEAWEIQPDIMVPTSCDEKRKISKRDGKPQDITVIM